jgi:hypothetical protein
MKIHNDWWSNDFACAYCRENSTSISRNSDPRTMPLEQLQLLEVYLIKIKNICAIFERSTMRLEKRFESLATTKLLTIEQARKTN